VTTELDGPRSTMWGRILIRVVRRWRSLHSSIGETGTPFQVGSQLQSIADTEGRLFLGVNDSDVENNAGEFTATIIVNP
jgi:hypothetical protein